MLSPDVRTVAMDLLRPPPGQQLDLAVLTTYTLDLEALLAVPLAVLAHSDAGVDQLLEDPLLILQGLREAGDRIHVFVDETGIAVPRRQRELYATLENSVHPVRTPFGGVFHPKVWVARFVSLEDNGDALLRVAVLSRNLTFDRSWDVALASEVKPGRRRVTASGPLGRLIGELVNLSTMPIPHVLADSLQTLAAQVSRAAFPGPADFSDAPIEFHAMGLGRSRRWLPSVPNGGDVLAVAPFLKAQALGSIRALGSGTATLVGRGEVLDHLSNACLAQWDNVRALAETAIDEPDDETSSRPSGLHAKIIAVQHGWDVTWWVGSANLTNAALQGRNVEIMAQITGRKRRVGIDKFLEGFDRLCETYTRSEEVEVDDEEDRQGQQDVEDAVRALAEAGLAIACTAADEVWEWRLDGRVGLSEGVTVQVWPVSVDEEQAVELNLPVTFHLPMTRLTAFAAFVVSSNCPRTEPRRFALKLPISGVPEERTARVLRSLIDSPERLLAFLRALLGGLEELGHAGDVGEAGKGAWAWEADFGAETLLEDMLRAASRDPSRLVAVRKLITDLRSTPEGRRIVPDRLHAVWESVDATLGVGR
ncbi:MAG: hypothetical protein F4149_12395 [Gammaproteobacteria bacterium]|nr:hypothetical protein [Gammaproteobacteria bacterium]MYK82090.1 hypothetical protein [Gammaproteobacteria bacterium]